MDANKWISCILKATSTEITERIIACENETKEAVVLHQWKRNSALINLGGTEFRHPMENGTPFR